jgi:hypothetical protein
MYISLSYTQCMYIYTYIQRCVLVCVCEETIEKIRAKAITLIPRRDIAFFSLVTFFFSLYPETYTNNVSLELRATTNIYIYKWE